MVAVMTPDEFEAKLARYLYERSEEARAVRVGEETSEQAAIVERYTDLFTREQHLALREAEEGARGEERERLYRLREAAAGGVIVRELAEESDALENSILAARVEFGESRCRSGRPRRASPCSTTTWPATSWESSPPTSPPASTALATG